MVEIAHQCRARLAAGHLASRTAHVDIDDRGAAGLGNACAFAHPARLAPGELHHMNVEPLPLCA